LPPKFKSWLIDFIAVNIPQIPVSQLVGFKQIEQVTANNSEVAALVSTASTTYTDLSGSPGPSLALLKDGQYLVTFGFTGSAAVLGVGAAMSIQVNSVTATDADWCSQDNERDASAARSVIKSLAAGAAGNTITAKYRSKFSGTSNYAKRWLIAQRIGPVPV
jgi:hypothetical protein